jgi:hypothetical protein
MWAETRTAAMWVRRRVDNRGTSGSTGQDIRALGEWFLFIHQGSTLTTVRLPGTTKSGCRASRYSFQLARRTTKYFTFLVILIDWVSKNLFRATSFNPRADLPNFDTCLISTPLPNYTKKGVEFRAGMCRN